MSSSPPSDLAAVLRRLEGSVEALAATDLAALDDLSLLELVGEVERIHGRLEHASDRIAGRVDHSGAHLAAGHRSAKAALQAIGGLSGAEAHARVRSTRVLRDLPTVAAGHAAGTITTTAVRTISRVLSNPRIRDLVPALDDVIASQATTATPDQLTGWLRDLVALLDADGADQAAAQTHERRHLSVTENRIDGSWHLQGAFGALQGATIAAAIERIEDELFDADLAETRDGAGSEVGGDLVRTATQRRADALETLCRRGCAAPSDARAPEPLVNIVIDQASFESQLQLLLDGIDRPDLRSPALADELDLELDLEARRCHTVAGTRLTPHDAIAAALIGHVRRVVVSSDGTVIDLGRRVRCFTGAAREAALLQAALADRGGLRCATVGCQSPPRRLQIDHRHRWRDGGTTATTNAQVLCGHHNRQRETDPDPADLWQIHRPD